MIVLWESIHNMVARERMGNEAVETSPRPTWFHQSRATMRFSFRSRLVHAETVSKPAAALQSLGDRCLHCGTPEGMRRTLTFDTS